MLVMCFFWLREKTYSSRKAKFTKKSQDMNQEPSSCEAPVLSTKSSHENNYGSVLLSYLSISQEYVRTGQQSQLFTHEPLGLTQQVHSFPAQAELKVSLPHFLADIFIS